MSESEVVTVSDERQDSPQGLPPDSGKCGLLVVGGTPEEEVKPLPVRSFLEVAHGRAHVGTPCHGQPSRAAVTLQVQGPFEGQGALSWEPAGALRAYDAAEGGTLLSPATFQADALAQSCTVHLEAVADAGAFVKRVLLTFSIGVGEDRTAIVTWLSPPPAEGQLVTLLDGPDRVDVPVSALGDEPDDLKADQAPAFVESCQVLRESLRTLRGLHDERVHRLTPLFCCGLGDLAGLLVRSWHHWLAGKLEQPGALVVRNQVRANHLATVKKLRKRLIKYLDALGPVFAGCAADAACVLGASGTGSDTHKKGQQVFIVRLGVAAQDRRTAKVVYKPRDERLSLALLGDTSCVVREGARYVASDGEDDGRRRRSAAERLNEWLAQANVATRLSTLRVLPGEPDADRLEQVPSKGVRSTYGFVEFVDSPLQGRTVANADDPLVVGYFREYGALCALCHLFALDDMHFENLRIRNHRPIATDIEIALRSVRRTTLRNGMLTPTIGPPFITWASWSKLTSPDEATSRLFFADSSPVELHLHQGARDALVQGYEHVLEAAGTHAQALVTAVEAHPTLRVRVLTRPTPVYGDRLKRFVAKLLEVGAVQDATDALRATFVGEDRTELARQLQALWNDYLEKHTGKYAGQLFSNEHLAGAWPPTLAQGTDQPAMLKAGEKLLPHCPEVGYRALMLCPFWALEAPGHEWDDYARLDYPAYYAEEAGRELYDARGAAVAVSDLDRTTVFAQPPWTTRKTEILALAVQVNRQQAVTRLQEDLAFAVQHYRDTTLAQASQGQVVKPG